MFSTHTRHIARLKSVHQQLISSSDANDFIVISRDGVDLDPQPCFVIKKPPNRVDASKERFNASIPADSVYVSGLISFDVMPGDLFFWDDKRWEVVEAGAIGINSVARRVRAELRPL